MNSSLNERNIENSTLSIYISFGACAEELSTNVRVSSVIALSENLANLKDDLVEAIVDLSRSWFSQKRDERRCCQSRSLKANDANVEMH